MSAQKNHFGAKPKIKGGVTQMWGTENPPFPDIIEEPCVSPCLHPKMRRYPKLFLLRDFIPPSIKIARLQKCCLHSSVEGDFCSFSVKRVRKNSPVNTAICTQQTHSKFATPPIEIEQLSNVDRPMVRKSKLFELRFLRFAISKKSEK